MQRGKYNTKTKNIIVNKIKDMGEFTVKELKEKLNDKTSYSTIYRILLELSDDNIIKKYYKDDNITYYEYLVTCDKNNHFFLKCLECGNKVHIDCDCVNDFNNHVFSKHKFKISDKNIMVMGICSNCLEKN